MSKLVSGFSARRRVCILVSALIIIDKLFSLFKRSPWDSTYPFKVEVTYPTFTDMLLSLSLQHGSMLLLHGWLRTTRFKFSKDDDRFKYNTPFSYEKRRVCTSYFKRTLRDIKPTKRLSHGRGWVFGGRRTEARSIIIILPTFHLTHILASAAVWPFAIEN